jgi:cephalosporin hydroxylase
LIIDDGLHNPEANLNVLLAYKNSVQRGHWLVIEDISKNDFNLRLWQLVHGLMPEFRTQLFNLPNTYVFIAQRV